MTSKRGGRRGFVFLFFRWGYCTVHRFPSLQQLMYHIHARGQQRCTETKGGNMARDKTRGCSISSPRDVGSWGNTRCIWQHSRRLQCLLCLFIVPVRELLLSSDFTYNSRGA